MLFFMQKDTVLLIQASTVLIDKRLAVGFDNMRTHFASAMNCDDLECEFIIRPHPPNVFRLVSDMLCEQVAGQKVLGNYLAGLQGFGVVAKQEEKYTLERLMTGM